MRAAAACTRAISSADAIARRRLAQRQRQAPNRLPLRGPAAAEPRAAAAASRSGGAGRRPRQLAVLVAARRGQGEFDRDDDYVAFDDEADWEREGSTIQAPGLGPVLNTALRGLNALTDRLTDVALQFAPADASPGVVRVAVNAGLVLLALSFVKSILGFFLTVGTIILGAYVGVKVFGIDVAGVTGSSLDGGGGKGALGGRPRSGGSGKRRSADPRGRTSEFKGLLGGGGKGDEDGLLDVWFERKPGSKGGGSKAKQGDRRRR